MSLPDIWFHQAAQQYAELISARDDAFVEDGPSSASMSALLAILRQIESAGGTSINPAKAWLLFRYAADVEFSWRFPERDRLAPEVIALMKTFRNLARASIEMHAPELTPELALYVEQWRIANLAHRGAILDNDRLSSWRDRLTVNTSKKLGLATGLGLLLFSLLNVKHIGFFGGLAALYGAWLVATRAYFLFVYRR